MNGSIIDLGAYGAQQREHVVKEKIKNLMNEKMDAILKTVWNGQPDFIPLPEWFISYFKTAVLNTPPKRVQVLCQLIEVISNKQLNEINIGEVGPMINFYGECEPSKYISTFEDFIPIRKAIDAIMLQHTNVLKNANNALLDEQKLLLETYDKKTWFPKSGDGFLKN